MNCHGPPLAHYRAQRRTRAVDTAVEADASGTHSLCSSISSRRGSYGDEGERSGGSAGCARAAGGNQLLRQPTRHSGRVAAAREQPLRLTRSHNIHTTPTHTCTGGATGSRRRPRSAAPSWSLHPAMRRCVCVLRARWSGRGCCCCCCCCGASPLHTCRGGLAGARPPLPIQAWLPACLAASAHAYHTHHALGLAEQGIPAITHPSSQQALTHTHTHTHSRVSHMSHRAAIAGAQEPCTCAGEAGPVQAGAGRRAGGVLSGGGGG